MRKIDFRVGLTGSFLFDTHQKALVYEVLRIFPELNKKEEDRVIFISGELSEERYLLWNTIVFNNTLKV